MWWKGDRLCWMMYVLIGGPAEKVIGSVLVNFRACIECMGQFTWRYISVGEREGNLVD